MPDTVKTDLWICDACDTSSEENELHIYISQSDAAFMIEFSVKITALPQNTGKSIVSHSYRAVHKTFHRTISSQTSFLIFHFVTVLGPPVFLPSSEKLPPAAWRLLEALIHTGNKRANSPAPSSLVFFFFCHDVLVVWTTRWWSCFCRKVT